MEGSENLSGCEYGNSARATINAPPVHRMESGRLPLRWRRSMPDIGQYFQQCKGLLHCGAVSVYADRPERICSPMAGATSASQRCPGRTRPLSLMEALRFITRQSVPMWRFVYTNGHLRPGRSTLHCPLRRKASALRPRSTGLPWCFRWGLAPIGAGLPANGPDRHGKREDRSLRLPNSLGISFLIRERTEVR